MTFADLDERLRRIHGGVANPVPIVEGEVMQVHRQELQALFDALLGEGYDSEKIEQVASLQESLRTFHSMLVAERPLEHPLWAADRLPRELNYFAVNIFRGIQFVIGESDFAQLFGQTPYEAAAAVADPMREPPDWRGDRIHIPELPQ